MAGGEPKGRRRRRWPRYLAIAFGFFVLLSVYTGGIDLYRAAQRSPRPVIRNAGVPPDHLVAHVETVSIDPNRGELLLRVEVRPDGKLAGPDGISVTVPVRIDVAGATGKASYRFAAGEHVSPVDVIVGLTGDVNSYPFDTYEAPVEVRVLALSPTSSDPTDVNAAYPTQMEFDRQLSSFRAHIKPLPAGAKPAPNVLALNLSITRARVTAAFAILMLVLMVLLAAAATTLALTITARHRRVEIAMLTWLAALMFAVVPLRNAMPGAPPIGALVDVLVFFWVVTLIALSLVTVLVTWIRQRPAAV